jgi:hypothetical protein
LVLRGVHRDAPTLFEQYISSNSISPQPLHIDRRSLCSLLIRPKASQRSQPLTRIISAALREKINLYSTLLTLNSPLLTPNSYLLTPNFFQACIQGFSCCDASLRNEGCFFFGSGLPKLASGQGGAEEETKGVALASQQGFYLFLLELEQDRI